MFIYNAIIFRGSFLSRLPKGNGRICIVLLGALLLAFMLALLGLALVQSEDAFEAGDFGFTEVSPATWRIGNLPKSFTSAFAPGVFALILFFDYLRSHIAEKRPVESIVLSSGLAFQRQFLATALLYSAVFLLFLFIASVRG